MAIKKILITAGPTWVPIDNTRVISNIATAHTGLLLAGKLSRLGAQVTLLLGPVQNQCCLDKKIKILPFRFFDELQRAILRELKSKKYDIVIHSAAVSDYRPALVYKQKVSSRKKSWELRLIPTPKMINLIKEAQENTLLVGFKFIPQAKRGVLLKASRRLLEEANADLVVANTIDKKGYTAYIVDKNTVTKPIFSKQRLTGQLIRKIIP